MFVCLHRLHNTCLFVCFFTCKLHKLSPWFHYIFWRRWERDKREGDTNHLKVKIKYVNGRAMDGKAMRLTQLFFEDLDTSKAPPITKFSL